jgi:translation initiation factor 2 subunit 3
VPIIPTAAHSGVNIDLLIETIEKHIPTPKASLDKPLRMFVARSFDINKPGAKPEELKGGALGGSIIQGEVKKGDKIEISPGPEEQKIVTVVTGISISEGMIGSAKPGGLISLGTALDCNITRNDQMRGQVVGKPETLPEATRSLKLEVVPLERKLEKKNFELKVNETLVLTVGTMTALGTVVRKAGKKEFELALKNSVVVDKGQKIAISQKQETGWRLTAYGVSQ